MGGEQDKQMKDVSGQQQKQMEESKAGQGESGMLPRGELWRDFDDWYKSIWEDYNRIDQEIERRFRDFSEMMFKNRQRQLEDFRREIEGREGRREQQAITGGAG